MEINIDGAVYVILIHIFRSWLAESTSEREDSLIARQASLTELPSIIQRYGNEILRFAFRNFGENK